MARIVDFLADQPQGHAQEDPVSAVSPSAAFTTVTP
jgi:hypothetical protein